MSKGRVEVFGAQLSWPPATSHAEALTVTVENVISNRPNLVAVTLLRL